MDPSPLPNQAPAFTKALLAWYQENYRPLPWRETPSLYSTVVSEFMCQQTQIATVLPYFDRWMKILPSFEMLTIASESLVIKLWEGLGYYSRARNLQKLAHQWMAAEPKPETAADWLAYPGVGPYTAAAIASITYEEHAAVVDGNVVRILARLTNDQREFSDNGKAVKAFTTLAGLLITHAERPGDHNQAMMELGATICSKANPQCLICPVKDFCEGQRVGNPAQLPRLAKRQIIQKRIDRVFLIHGGRLLIHRIPTTAKRLAGLCELPPGDLLEVSFPAELILTRRRGIANERIEERFLRIDWNSKLHSLITKDETLFWQPLNQLNDITLTGPHRKWLAELMAL
ncbi:A/G-specific adenine glycosylase [Cerasicoccus arenae]|uniref:A/G-specific adenine glycosylase n=1 Tax=Cerasicoccus arenae TaxID=424488 RepID=A0A8J3DBL4_9BACT|nr:A/G-specific adenine glycosylase [Cerasicoccus arenae]MBK1856774.1 A/G-specific adenine glycosylase [Cerasicoccus arenae]GHB99418.1 A/G-specific adenine glycosylase [Cerasicoccus arenae]